MTAQDITLPALAFNGHVIHDRKEMLSLTDMWRAAGEPESKRPANWARKEGAEFIAFMADAENMPVGHIIRAGRGRTGATFAHWQIGLAYAKCLSPEFHMWCNTVVRERMEGGRQSSAIPVEVLEEIRRTDGISRMLAHKVTEQGKDIAALVQTVTALAGIVKPGVPGVYRPGKTSGAILRAAGFTRCPTRLALWFGNRLEAAGCRVEGRIDTGTGRARLFDPDKAEEYLRNGGAAAVEKKIVERRGQGALAFDIRDKPSQRGTQLLEGQGAMMLEGKMVLYDTNIEAMKAGDMALVVTNDGRVAVDMPTVRGSHMGFGMRGALASPVEEDLPGLRRKMFIEWGCAVIGRVLEIRDLPTTKMIRSGAEQALH